MNEGTPQPLGTGTQRSNGTAPYKLTTRSFPASFCFILRRVGFFLFYQTIVEIENEFYFSFYQTIIGSENEFFLFDFENEFYFTPRRLDRAKTVPTNSAYTPQGAVAIEGTWYWGRGQHRMRAQASQGQGPVRLPTWKIQGLPIRRRNLKTFSSSV